MIFDKESMFSDAQAITGDAASTNVIDLGLPGTPKHAAGPIRQDLGAGRAIPFRAQVVAAFNNLTSLAVIVQTDSDEAFGSATEVARLSAPLASLQAGFVFPMLYIPYGLAERYVRLSYDVTGTAPDEGAVTAGLVFGNETWAV